MLVQLVQGATTYRYTTISTPITRATYVWTPEAIVLGTVSSSGEIPKDTLTIKLPKTNACAATFVGYVPDVVTTVTVFRSNYDDTEVVTYWKGRVLSTTVSAGVVTLTCEPIFSSLKRLGLRPVYSRTCRHVLFGRGCNVSSTDWDHVGTCTAVNGAVVTVTDAHDLPDLTGGTLVYGGVTRTIVVHDGDDLTLMRSNRAIALGLVATPAGVSVTMYEGCNRTLVTCRDKFGNLGNFGGFPGLPSTNPMYSANTMLVRVG
jgi:uncharacterized phage protein (TIGR02218 family)